MCRKKQTQLVQTGQGEQKCGRLQLCQTKKCGRFADFARSFLFYRLHFAFNIMAHPVAIYFERSHRKSFGFLGCRSCIVHDAPDGTHVLSSQSCLVVCWQFALSLASCSLRLTIPTYICIFEGPGKLLGNQVLFRIPSSDHPQIHLIHLRYLFPLARPQNEKSHHVFDHPVEQQQPSIGFRHLSR